MRLAVLGTLTALLTMVYAPAASASSVWYSGPHPIDTKVLKGMCYIPGSHVHSYAPVKPLLFVKAGRHNQFVGDPVEYEIEAPKHAYYGHHPLFWIDKGHRGKNYCYITGPHHHWYKPPKHLKFKHKGNVHWYVGGHPDWYVKTHPRATQLREHYHGIGIPLPHVTVSAPVGFVGLMVGAGWLTGHYMLKWHGGGWHGSGPMMYRWHGDKWKRPKWRRGHWNSPRWRARWKGHGYGKGHFKKHGYKHGYKHGNKHGIKHGKRTGGKRHAGAHRVMQRTGK